MEKKAVIYKITNPSNKVYIGQTTNVLKRKGAYRRLDSCIQNQIVLYRSLKKYGWDAHIFEIIEECLIELLNERERYWQEYYDVLGENGLNCVLTETDTLKRISSLGLSISMANADENLLKDYLIIWELCINGKQTKEIKKVFPNVDDKVLWKIKSGTHWFNKYLKEKHNIEYEQYKNSISFNRFSNTKRKEILKLYYEDNFTVEKIKELVNCNRITLYKILQIKKKKPSKKPTKILQYDLNMNFIKEWDSPAQIEECLNFTKNCINAACNGNLKTYKKFLWRYKK